MMPDEDEYRSYQNALYEQFARVGKAVDSPRRVELLELLSQAERTVQKLAELTDMSVANTSRHLRILLQARLVEKEKKGVYAWYRLADDSVYEFFHALRNVAESRLAEVQRITAELFGSEDQVESVDRDTLLQRARDGEVTVIDVRPPEEYSAGHIPGAISIPLEDLEDRLAELPRDRRIVAYCRGPHCILAARAVEMLQARGFQAVRLDGGPGGLSQESCSRKAGT